MTKLSVSKKDFLNSIAGDPESRRWGLQKLAARNDMLDFLSDMVELGFFLPETNPGPIAVGAGVRILYWEPLAYLENAAKRASKLGDTTSIAIIIDIVRKVTRYKNIDGIPIDNYYTWHSFSKIMSVVPTSAYTVADIEMVETWVQSKYERGGLIGAVIGELWLQNYYTASWRRIGRRR